MHQIYHAITPPTKKIKRKAKIRIREKYAIPGFLVAGHGFEPWTSGL